MQSSAYYREQAARARRLASLSTNGETAELLMKLALDYDKWAADVEADAAGPSPSREK